MAFKIENLDFGGSKTIIIAEAGVNHLGRMDYAEELVKSAARAGADVIKFQTYKAKNLTTKNAPRFWSWEGEKNSKGSQYDSYIELDSFERDDYKELINLCSKYNIVFLSTPFDEDAVDMLVNIGIKGFKIASCDINNIPFLSYVAKKNLPMLLSTGAADIQDIKYAVKTIEESGNHQIGIMHCTLCYPTNPTDSNLSAIGDIRDNFPQYPIGLSDHTLGIVVPVASVCYGVKFIEKHYTIDKTLPGSADHWLSLNEVELAEMVANVRILESAVGSGKKVRLECETPAYLFARRSVVASVDIPKDTLISNQMLTMKRPGTGLAPIYRDRIVGRIAARDIAADTLLSLDDIN